MKRLRPQIMKKGKRKWQTIIKLLLFTGLLSYQSNAMAKAETDDYTIETVKWDKVPAENREAIEQLFADMTLVPDGEEVKKFYISTHDVQKSLWNALMVTADSLPVDNISSSDIQKFITQLRKQTGKRFRLPTETERLWAAECQLIDTIADAANNLGKGFYLALDTIGKSVKKMLVITATDGTLTRYLLENVPQVKIEGGYLRILAGRASVSLPLERLQHMHYEIIKDEATAIEEIVVNKEKTGSEHIDFSNLPADATISIYTLDGKLINNIRPTEGKTLSLMLGSLRSGVYLVKVNDVTYKIQKP